jgi:hypothetical protein
MEVRNISYIVVPIFHITNYLKFNKMKKSFIFFLLLFLLVHSKAFSATIHVPADYPNVQAAIDASNDGDTVLVADGIYTGEGNRNILLNEKDIVIKSEHGADYCTFDGSGEDEAVGFNVPDSFSVFRCMAMIQGFTFQNFKSGIYCLGEKSSPVIKDNIFKNCYGEVLYFGNGTHSLIMNNEIYNNTDVPCVIYLRGTDVTLKNNYIHHNGLSESNTESNDGIIFCEWNDSSTIEFNKITNNMGCGILLDHYSKNVTITGNEIKNNRISKLIEISTTKYNGYNDPVQIVHGGYIYSGGAIAVMNSSTASVRNNLILGNESTHAGGIFCDSTSMVDIINNNVIANGSKLYGSLTLQNPASTVMNNIVINAYGSTRLERWFLNDLFSRINYEGAKVSSVDYYLGFKNNGDAAEVKIKGPGYNSAFNVQSGEYYWLETNSKVDDYGNFGGLNLNITMGMDTLEFIVNRALLNGGCILLSNTNLQSYGTAAQGMTAPGTGIYTLADEPFQNIGYNDFYNNQNGNYASKSPRNDPGITLVSLPDGAGNISADPGLSNSYSLNSGSPCIDAGNPGAQYNDALLPPGLGSARNDMGMYGGVKNSEIVYVPTSIAHHGFDSDITVYPNPSSGNVFLDMGKTYTNLEVVVSDITGQISQSMILRTADQVKIDIQGPAGIYFITLRSENGESACLKIVKEE